MSKKRLSLDFDLDSTHEKMMWDYLEKNARVKSKHIKSVLLKSILNIPQEQPKEETNINDIDLDLSCITGF